jgi:hypothetical protein
MAEEVAAEGEGVGEVEEYRCDPGEEVDGGDGGREEGVEEGAVGVVDALLGEWCKSCDKKKKAMEIFT